MKKKKSRYGVKLTTTDASKFDMFQDRFSHILPSMNTVYSKHRTEIVKKWLEDRIDGINEKATALDIQEKYKEISNSKI